MLDNNDIKLCYFGGSGGFIVLHLLLLSKKFFCAFRDDISIEEIVDQQWKISSPAQWKSSEFWPDNHKTRQSDTDLRKIFFFCGPDIKEVNDFNGKIFFIYLDADSQIEMARYKNAYWFGNESTRNHKNYISYYRSKLKSWTDHYANIKDPSWPRCTGPAGFRALPRRIQDELNLEPHTAVYLDIEKYSPINLEDQQIKIQELNCKKTLSPDGIAIMPHVLDFLKHADLSMTLTDIINDLDLLCNITQTNIVQSQIELRDKWIKLHPQQLLNDVGININLGKINAEQP